MGQSARACLRGSRPQANCSRITVGNDAVEWVHLCIARSTSYSMTQERNSRSEVLIADEFSGHGYAIGRSISRVFHPITLNVVTILIVGYFALASPAIGLMWAGICLLIQVVPSTLFYLVRARQGAFSDEDVS